MSRNLINPSDRQETMDLDGVTCTRVGQIVTLTIRSNMPFTLNGRTKHPFGTLPEGWRPAVKTEAYATTLDPKDSLLFTANTDGVVSLWNNLDASRGPNWDFVGHLTYIAKQGA